jgi:hypothetical protein
MTKGKSGITFPTPKGSKDKPAPAQDPRRRPLCRCRAIVPRDQGQRARALTFSLPCVRSAPRAERQRSCSSTRIAKQVAHGVQ